jgi:16S rRNA (cytosine1402-N4)-methyltransferase
MQRGLSFKDLSAPLDMRVDRDNQAITAATLLNVLPQNQLLDLFMVAVDRGEAKRLVDKIVIARNGKKFEIIGDLLTLVGNTKHFKVGLHPATLPFLALRIAVNSELDNLREVLPKAFSLLVEGGRLAVISFHSGEDAIVKRYFEEEKIAGLASIATKKPIVASESEISDNPKSRSAKLRILEKL